MANSRTNNGSRRKLSATKSRTGVMRQKSTRPPKHILTMKYAGGLIKHLGLQMYSGAVPSIAELVKNSYDANASEVDITIPFDKPWGPSSSITVKDSGHGMRFSDCDNKYLVLGRDRRAAEGDRVEGSTTRRPIGRKGIGKLAGFGIAEVVNVRTVRDRKRTQFEMNYRDIERLRLGKPYRPKVVEAEISTREKQGTTVTLSGIKLQRSLNEEEFRYSLAKYFALLSDEFVVKINGKPLKRDEIELQFRFPEVSKEAKERFNYEDVPGCGTIKWWIGFTQLPIKKDEDRGVVIMVRDTVAQKTPFFFGLTGGAGGQLGLQYLTGEVYADSLDQEAIDAIATDRASINWEKEESRPLLEWGQKKLRQLLDEWSKKRRRAQEDRLRRHTKYIDTVARFPERQRAELIKAIEKLASIETIEDERLDDLVKILIQAYEQADIISIIKQLMAATPEERARVFEVLAEWNIVEAVSMARLIKGRMAVIDKFEQLRTSGAPEKVKDRDDMQGFLAENPLLIDASLTMTDHEASLDNMLVKHFKVKPTKSKEGAKRLDFFCLRGPSNVVVVEVKGAEVTAGKKEVRQLVDYVEFFQGHGETLSTDPSRPAKHVTGYLIAKHLTPDGKKEAVHALARGVMFRAWEDLSEAAIQSHQEFYDMVKKRVDPNDPRVEILDSIGND